MRWWLERARIAVGRCGGLGRGDCPGGRFRISTRRKRGEPRRATEQRISPARPKYTEQSNSATQPKYAACAPVERVGIATILGFRCRKQAWQKGSKIFQPQMHADARRCIVRSLEHRRNMIRNFLIPDNSHLSICVHLRESAVDTSFLTAIRKPRCHKGANVSQAVAIAAHAQFDNNKSSAAWPSVVRRTSSVLKSCLLAEQRASVAVLANAGASP